MQILSGAYFAVAVACVAVGIERVIVALRVPERRVHLLFGATAAAAAVDAIVQRRFASAATAAEFDKLFAWSAVSICTFLLLLVWFIDTRTGAVRRALRLPVIVLLIATAAIDFVLPAGLRATMYVSSVREAVLPWGEVFMRPVGEASPWRLVGDLANIGFLILLLDTTIRLVKRDKRRQARLIGASLVALALSVLAIIPEDLGLIDLPSLHPFAFLLIVALMCWDLSDSVARAAVLSREVVANERRYRELVETSTLLIVTLDCEGRIVSLNPAAEAVAGRPAAELIGRHAADLAMPDEREDMARAVDGALAGRIPEENERLLRTADGRSRVIAWRSILLHDAQGEVEGLLSLGADVTERRQAEAARDRALTELERSVAELEELRRRLEEENLALKERVEPENKYKDIVGTSDAMRYVLHKIEQVAGTDATVLIQGETGVGKELVARTIHEQSKRASAPFIAVNCAALAPSVIESELFGHEKGAFTGADRQRKGRFELADGGTLFLDEVGELPLAVQPKLLRALEHGEFDRVGGTRTESVNVRIIAATNRDLRVEVAAGRFREDLFYRLEVYPITVPPLRDRREDIAPLVGRFVRRLNQERGTDIREVPPEVLRRFQSYSWPGNVRELANVIERAVLTSRDHVLRLADPLPELDKEPLPLGAGDHGAISEGQVATLDEVTAAHILAVVKRCEGRIAGPGGAAELLGLHPNTLRSRMRKLGITNHARPRTGSPRPAPAAGADFLS